VVRAAVAIIEQLPELVVAHDVDEIARVRRGGLPWTRCGRQTQGVMSPFGSMAT